MRLPLLVRILAATGMAAFAQSQLGTGAISGTVVDPSKAAVTGAEITVTQAETGLTRRLTSNDSGQFLAPVLPTGTYHVRVVKTGFGTMEQSDVVVDVGGTTNIAVQL